MLQDSEKHAYIDDVPDKADMGQPSASFSLAQAPTAGGFSPASNTDTSVHVDLPPWWTCLGNSDEAPSSSLSMLHELHTQPDAKQFTTSLTELTRTMVQRDREYRLALARGDDNVSIPNSVDLRFNVFAVVLAYAFLVRQLGAASLSTLELHGKPSQALFDVLVRLLPCLVPNSSHPTFARKVGDHAEKNPASSSLRSEPLAGTAAAMVLPNVEQACLFFLSNLLTREQGTQPSQLLQELLGDVRILLSRSKVQVQQSSSTSNDTHKETHTDVTPSEWPIHPVPPPSVEIDSEVAQGRIGSYRFLVCIGYDLSHLLGTYQQPDSQAPRQPSRTSRGTSHTSKWAKAMQRKWLFYLASYLSTDASLPEPAASFPALGPRKRPRSLMGQLDAQQESLEREAQQAEFEADLRATERFQQTQNTCTSAALPGLSGSMRARSSVRPTKKQKSDVAPQQGTAGSTEQLGAQPIRHAAQQLNAQKPPLVQEVDRPTTSETGTIDKDANACAEQARSSSSSVQSERRGGGGGDRVSPEAPNTGVVPGLPDTKEDGPAPSDHAPSLGLSRHPVETQPQPQPQRQNSSRLGPKSRFAELKAKREQSANRLHVARARALSDGSPVTKG